jgi:hypothetical protein
MNYLKKNLHNSQSLPYDVMKLISEYAKPYYLKQIENKDYDLDEIMYRRMINLITKYPHRYDNDMIEFLDKLDVVDIYKGLFLQEHKFKKICGVYSCHNIESRKYKMLCDLQHAKIYKCRNI